MLVFYSGWGYWEDYCEEEKRTVHLTPLREEYCLFQLPKKAEMEITYQGETTVSYLLNSEHSNPSKSPDDLLFEYPIFILCEKPQEEQGFSSNNGPTIEVTKRYTKDDIFESPVVNDVSKDLTETERSTMLKLILSMAIDAYGYDPDKSRNTATGSNNGSIKAALQKIGLDADGKTISKYLKDAAERYPDAKPRKT